MCIRVRAVTAHARGRFTSAAKGVVQLEHFPDGLSLPVSIIGGATGLLLRFRYYREHYGYITKHTSGFRPAASQSPHHKIQKT